MLEIEDALRILDLKPGATVKHVVEAREDLLALWNPDRLSNAPRLRSKAADKILEIHEAYETLMRHLGEPASAGSFSSLPGDGGASLYDEVFSKSKKPTVPLWLIVVLSAALVVAGLYLSQFLGSAERETAPAESPVESPSQTEPPPATQPDTTSAVGDSTSDASPKPTPAETAATPKPSAPLKAESPQVAPPSAEQGPKPTLKRKVIGSEAAQDSADEERETRQAAEQQKRAVAEKAFQDLLSNSLPARNLAKGQFWNLQFDHWQVVQQTDSEVWLDLVALRPNGMPAHHIWAVRIADGIARPLSEAARDLEHTKPGAENGR